jgi:ELWxxDGT repeat protein
VIVKDINKSEHSLLMNLTNVNGTIYFKATNGISGQELWKSDGTPSGTIKVKDIHKSGVNTRRLNPTSYCASFFHSGEILFFTTMNDKVRELWKSDGTPEGTVMVKKILPYQNKEESTSANPPQEIEKSLIDQLLHGVTKVISFFKGLIGFQSSEPASDNLQQQEESAPIDRDLSRSGLANKPSEPSGVRKSGFSNRPGKPEAKRRSVSPDRPKKSRAMSRTVSPDRRKRPETTRRSRSQENPIQEAYKNADYKTVTTLLNRKILDLEKDIKRNERELFMTRYFLAYVYAWRLDESDLALKQYRKISEIRESNDKFKEMPRMESIYIGRIYEKEGDLDRALEHYRDFHDKAIAQKESENDTELVMIADEMINVTKYRMDGINLKLKGKKNFKPLLGRLSVMKQPYHLQLMQFMIAIVVPHVVYEYSLLMGQDGESRNPEGFGQIDYIMQSPDDIGSSIMNYVFVLGSAAGEIGKQQEQMMEAYLARYPESYYSLKLRYLFSEYYRENGQPKKSRRLLKEIKTVAKKRGIEILTEADTRFATPEKTWARYRRALAEGDKDAALDCIAPWGQKNYREIFNKLGLEGMKKLSNDMGEIYREDGDENEARYDMLTERDGQTYSYPVSFVNMGGEWKISFH